MRSFCGPLTLAFVVLVPTSLTAAPRLRVGYETGPAYVAQNDGRYGESGTEYDAGDVGQQKTLARVERAFIELGSGRHQLILTYIPFELRTRVALQRELRFRSTIFPAGTVVDHRYLFDGTRASYLYELFGAGAPWLFQVGASFQIRSADVAFSAADGSLHAAEDDIGPVGALKLRLTYSPTPDCAWARLDADAISTFGLIGDTTGGLYDVALVLGLPVHDRFDLTFTTRVYGGGADVPDRNFKNWGTFLSATAGIVFTLP
ncbi:MAG TPA: hypothetical protein VGF45_08780 [Polyangia bacterium]